VNEVQMNDACRIVICQVQECSMTTLMTTVHMVCVWESIYYKSERSISNHYMMILNCCLPLELYFSNFKIGVPHGRIEA
jgi:hypothetical protein